MIRPTLSLTMWGAVSRSLVSLPRLWNETAGVHLLGALVLMPTLNALFFSRHCLARSFRENLLLLQAWYAVHLERDFEEEGKKKKTSNVHLFHYNNLIETTIQKIENVKWAIKTLQQERVRLGTNIKWEQSQERNTEGRACCTGSSTIFVWREDHAEGWRSTAAELGLQGIHAAEGPWLLFCRGQTTPLLFV